MAKQVVTNFSFFWCFPNKHSHLQVPWSSRVVLWIKSPHSRPFCFPWNSTAWIGSVVPKIFRPFGMWEWLFSMVWFCLLKIYLWGNSPSLRFHNLGERSSPFPWPIQTHKTGALGWTICRTQKLSSPGVKFLFQYKYKMTDATKDIHAKFGARAALHEKIKN